MSFIGCHFQCLRARFGRRTYIEVNLLQGGAADAPFEHSDVVMLTIASEDGDVAEVVSCGELSNFVDGALDRKDVGGEGEVRVIDDDVELEAIAGFIEATSLDGFVEGELGDGDSDARELFGIDVNDVVFVADSGDVPE